MQIKILTFSVAVALLSNSVFANIFTPLDNDIVEPNTIYTPSSADILTINLKTVIGSGQCIVGDYEGCTLEDVNNDIDSHDQFKPGVKVHFQADDFIDDQSITNATLRMRGGYSRFATQKSYRLKLNSKKDLWRGQRKLQLNKHPWDLTRVRNKLSFDLMQGIPHLPSLRSQFVHLSIDDTDYGLYTHIENVGKEYLLRRGWDKHSNIYKASDFSFGQRDTYAINTQGQPIDEAAFEQRLEIKRGKDHHQFAAMLAAVNDDNNDFQKDVLDKYFNRNNYLTWMAVNILTGNVDVSSSNFYLYNPKGTDDFYFLPWDYDDTWGIDEQPDNVAGGTTWEKHQFNPQHLWTSKFHQRFLKQSNALDLIEQAVTQLKNTYFTESRITTLLEQYARLIAPIVMQNPDLNRLPTVAYDSDEKIMAEYAQVYSQLLGRVEQNYQRFLKEKESPMPFFLDTPTVDNTGKIHFAWDAAFDPQGDPVRYDLDVASTPDFRAETIRLSVSGIHLPHYEKQWNFGAGQYFYRVVARDSKGHWQNSNEEYVTKQGTAEEVIYHNAFTFKVKNSGISTKAVSNPIQNGTMVFDGQLDEWQNLSAFTADSVDISATTATKVDWQQAWIAHDKDNFYFANRYNSRIDMSWGYITYLDTDQNKLTGFRGTNAHFPIGVDYMIQGYSLWKYTGINSTDWQWDYVSLLPRVWSQFSSEMSIPRSLWGNPAGINVFFEGNNIPYGNIVSDFYPDNVFSAHNYFTYSTTP